MYLSVGIVGYIMFGEKAESQFTLNMPKELYASKIAIWTTVRKQINLLFSFCDVILYR
jgi:vesicular inhibitory amino acid transporter